MAKARPNIYQLGTNHWKICWYEPVKGRRRRRKWKRVHCDQQTAIRLQAKFQNDAEARASGLIDPAAEKYAHESRQPIAQHIADFESVLDARRNTPKHVAETAKVIEDTARRCGWKSIADISGTALSTLLAKLASNDRLSARTLNKRRMACRMFTKWLHQEQLLRVDPLANVRAARESDDRRRVRRDLSLDECRRLIAATVREPRRARLDGDARALLYRLILGTGLRVGESVTLRRADFELDSDPALVRVSASYSKRRRQDTQPIPPDTAAALRIFVGELRSADLVWPNPVKTDLSRALAKDLLAARRAWLDEAQDPEERRRREDADFLRPVDSGGRVVDMHALRHTFVSAVVRGGASAKVAQTLARHSTPTLTMNVYAHAQLDEVRAGIGSLPTLDQPLSGEADTFKSAGRVPRPEQAPERRRFRSGQDLASRGKKTTDGAADIGSPETSRNKAIGASGQLQSIPCNALAGVAELADAADSKSAAP